MSQEPPHVIVPEHVPPVALSELDDAHQQKLDTIAHHVRGILSALGLDLKDPNLAETDLRVAKMYIEMFHGLSKVARILEFYAKRPQLQERLTEQVVTFLEEKLQPQGAMVVIEARHLCVEMRGVKKPGALTVTSALRGIFHQKPVREEFLDLLRHHG